LAIAIMPLILAVGVDQAQARSSPSDQLVCLWHVKQKRVAMVVPPPAQDLDCFGGHTVSEYEQNTQQSPSLGRMRVEQDPQV
jgi:hypothetical protein